MGSDVQGSDLNLTGLEDLSGFGTITTTLCVTTDWISVVPNEIGQYGLFPFQLDYGERQVIWNALKMPAPLVLLDDRLARNIAEYLGLKVKGTLGVLAEAKQKGLIFSFKELVMAMKVQGFRYSLRLIDEVALKLGE